MVTTIDRTIQPREYGRKGGMPCPVYNCGLKHIKFVVNANTHATH